jgi:uncharacterized membrane protein YdbT with pleckstrin-like domain
MDKNSIPKAFQKVLMNDEEVLAVTKKHSLWILGWWLNPINLILGICTLGLLFLYKLHIIKNEVIIITNKRIIASVSPKLFTKDKIELTLKGVDNIREDETLFGNIFGWTAIQIETRSDSYTQRQITKDSMKALRNKFYELQK